jgi:phosphatidylglycerophosphate synthase
MIVAKQVADFLTFARLLLAFFLVWLGVVSGAGGLEAAALALICSWTTDALDGPIARRSRVQYNTWLGDHDLEVDMAVACGLLFYLVLSGLVSTLLAAAYALVAGLAFWHWGLLRSPGMLFQAPIYGGFIYLALARAPLYGTLLIAWIVLAVAITWPRFPDEVVPGFLHGMRALGDKRKR